MFATIQTRKSRPSALRRSALVFLPCACGRRKSPNAARCSARFRTRLRERERPGTGMRLAGNDSQVVWKSVILFLAANLRAFATILGQRSGFEIPSGEITM